MAVRPIINCLDSKLRDPSAPVERVDDELNRLIDDMFETMYEAPGIGLAAIQIAVPRRVLVTDVAGDGEKPSPLALINPEVVWVSDERSVYNEGCLSVPDQYAEVERPAMCRIEYVDREGKQQSLDAGGLLATCVQHEIDHLNGVLFIDHLSRLKRNMLVKKVAKLTREKEKAIL